MTKSTKALLIVNGIGVILMAISVYFYDYFQTNFDEGLEAYNKREYLLAEAKFTKALNATKEFNDLDYRISLSSFYLAKTYRALGKNREKAEELFKQAFSISEASPDPSNWSYINEIRQEIALIYLEKSEYKQAQTLLQAALVKLSDEMNKRNEMSPEQFKSQSEILSKLTFSKNMERIISLYGTTRHIETIEILKSFATFNYNQGRYESSKIFFDQAEEILDVLGKE